LNHGRGVILTYVLPVQFQTQCGHILWLNDEKTLRTEGSRTIVAAAVR
jgi:hypothetical protein